MGQFLNNSTVKLFCDDVLLYLFKNLCVRLYTDTSDMNTGQNNYMCILHLCYFHIFEAKQYNLFINRCLNYNFFHLTIINKMVIYTNSNTLSVAKLLMFPPPLTFHTRYSLFSRTRELNAVDSLQP